MAVLNGGSESVGVSFSGRQQGNVAVVNSVLDGQTANGQSFGIWVSVPQNEVLIDNTYIHNWDYPIGNFEGVSYSWSSFETNGAIAGVGTDLDGQSNFIPHFAHTPGDDMVVGDPSGKRYLAGDGNDFIAGMEGYDHLFGNQGSDTFAYVIPQTVFDKDVVMDFQRVEGDKFGFAREVFGAADNNGTPRLQFGVEATGNQATFLQYTQAYTLYYNSDGAGPTAKIPIAYIPYVILTAGDLAWLDAPLPSQTFKQFSPTWSVAAIGQFNNDANADLIWQHSSGALSEWLMFDGLRAAPFRLPDVPGSRLFAAADLNGDGATDLLWRGANDIVTTWFMKEGQRIGTAQLGHSSFKDWDLVATGDFNGDGTTDLISQSAITGKLCEWLMDNGKPLASVTFPAQPGLKFAAAGDFNGDGTTDLIWQNPNGTFSEWLMATNGHRSATLALPAMKGWKLLTSGDFNDDGTDDLLWQHTASNALVTWDMANGARNGGSFGNSAGQQFLGAGDVNGDGTADLLWRNLATTDIKVWLV